MGGTRYPCRYPLDARAAGRGCPSWNTNIVWDPLDIDVAVGMRRGFFPLPVVHVTEGQRIKCRLLDRLEALAAQDAKALFLLKALARKPQGTAVSGDGPDDVVRRTCENLSFDFERHPDFGTHEAGKVRDHLIGDAAGVSSDTRWIKRHGAMKAPGRSCRCVYRYRATTPILP